MTRPAPAWVRRPAYSGASLATVVPAAARACGIALPGEADDAGTWPSGTDAPAVCVVLADGLGYHNLAARAGHAPFLSRLPARRAQTGFPSTTVASLATFGTGLPPGATGLAGYSLRDPSTGRRAVLIGWDTPTPPRVWQPNPTVFERLAAAGRPGVFVGQRRFADSPMTEASLRGARFMGADRAGERVEAAAAAAAGGGVVYLYWGEIDKAGHAHGWESWEWGQALEELDAAMRALRAALPRRAGLWLTADHGMVDVGAGPRWDIGRVPALAEAVDLVAGEPRAIHLYSASPGEVAARWRSELGDAAWVLEKAEAVAQGLFGPVAQRVEPMLGDVIVAAAGTACVVDSRDAKPSALAMVGHHGSLTRAEMDIPFIAIPA
jgi:hypothetical protein